MGFFGKFFVAIFAVCAARGAWAQCCWCEEYDGCPEGQEPYDGQCVGDWGDCCLCYDDCEYICGPGGPYCDTFQDSCPPGLGPEYRCKVSQPDCGSGCKKYQSCNSINGNLGPDVVSENCHLENNVCYANTRACREFSNRTENSDISCTQTAQQHQATWNGTTWYVGGCSCDIANVEIGTGPFGIPWWCDRFNANFYVSQANQNVSSASDKIVYTMSRMYCSKCHPGYLPKIETSAQINGIYVRPENSGNGDWGVGMCNEQVTQPNYATGCVIDFGLPSGQAAYNDCLGICPTGSATESDGATDITQCIADYSQTYEDGTGWFVLGGFETCP